MHFRGPTLIKQLAVYYPGSDAKVKRSDNVHAHAHRHGQQHVHHPRRDHALAGRAVGDMVVATIDGQVVSWVNKYAGPGAGPSTAAAQPLPVAQTTLATSFGTPSQAPSSTTTSASSDPINPLPHAESSSGGSEQWARQAYFNADAGSSEGFTFLNHFGGTNGMPGTADGGPAYVLPQHQKTVTFLFANLRQDSALPCLSLLQMGSLQPHQLRRSETI